MSVKSKVVCFHLGETVICLFRFEKLSVADSSAFFLLFILVYDTVAEAFNISGADSLSLSKLPLSLKPQIGLGLSKQTY